FAAGAQSRCLRRLLSRIVRKSAAVVALAGRARRSSPGAAFFSGIVGLVLRPIRCSLTNNWCMTGETKVRSSMPLFSVLFPLVSNVLLIGTALAQEERTVPGPTPGTLTAAPPTISMPSRSTETANDTSTVDLIPAKGRPILLEAGKGTLIRLPRPAATVFIANPDVADVQVKSPAMIYVNAKTPGETVLYAVDADDNVLLNAAIRVEHDVSRLRQSLRAVIPGENVAVESVDGSLVLKGNVSTALRAERANALATAIASEAKGKVVNQLSVATPNQVNLRVKVAEVSRTVLKSLGINWAKAITATSRITFATANPT